CSCSSSRSRRGSSTRSASPESSSRSAAGGVRVRRPSDPTTVPRHRRGCLRKGTTMRKSVHVAVAGSLVLALGACSSGGGSGSGGSADEISYWLWASNQVPAYQAGADAFAAKHTTGAVQVEQ